MSEGMQQLSNGVKLVSETLLPGTSLLMDGRVKEGVLHAATGLVARSLIGPIGWGLVAANSFAKSVSEQGVMDLASEMTGDVRKKLARKPKAEDATTVSTAEAPAADDAKPASSRKTAAAKA